MEGKIMEGKFLSNALYYASILHKNQKRKDKDKTPYINHLIEVMNILVNCDILNEKILAGAILHDIIEDTKGTYENLKEVFDERIANLVLDCTDNKLLEKKERKLLQIEKIQKVEMDVVFIKVADKISNLNSLIEQKPFNWSYERIQGYIIWSNLVVEKRLEDLPEKLKKLYIDTLSRVSSFYKINEIKDKNIAFEQYLNIL